MKAQPILICVNGDGRPVHMPSRVLCQECLDVLDAKIRALGAQDRAGKGEK